MHYNNDTEPNRFSSIDRVKNECNKWTVQVEQFADKVKSDIRMV